MAKRTTPHKSKSSPPPAMAIVPPAREPLTREVLVKNESVIVAAMPMPMSVTGKPNARATHEEIARRAFELFLARGGRNGHQLEDWLAAERELVRVA